MKYRPEIDGLRALAVLAVVLYHAGFPFITGGFVGVDIFFVISGYLITGIIYRELKSGQFSFAKFYERRCRRILPPLVVMTLTVIVLSWFWLMPLALRDMGRSLAAMITFWANIFFYKTTGYFEAAANTKPLLHTWSLSVEEQFYVLFPFILFVLYKCLGNRAKKGGAEAQTGLRFLNNKNLDLYIFLILALIAALSLVASAQVINRDPSAVFYLSQYRIWELMIGSLLAIAPPGPVFNRAGQKFFGTLAMALMLLPVFFYSHNTSFPGLAALPPCLGAGLFIYIHSQGLYFSPIGRFMASKVPVAIGKISYSFYLWHWPLLILPAYNQGRPLSLAQSLLLVSLSALLAALSWRFIEQPVRAKKVFISRKRIFQAAVLTMIILAAGGRIIKMEKGFPSRLSPEAASYYETAMIRGDFINTGYPSGRLDYLNESDKGRVFVLGSRESWPPDFLILGDSHARDWAIGFDPIAARLGMSGIYIMTGGLPLPGTHDICMKGDSNSRWVKLAQKIMEAEGIQNVVISGYYRRAIGEQTADDVAAGPCISDDSDYKTPQEARWLFSRQFDELTDSFLKEGRKVWLFSSTPDFSQNVPQMLTFAIERKIDIDQFSYSRFYYNQRNRHVAVVLHSQANKPGVTLIDVSKALCPDGRCLAGDSEGSLYIDSNHLSLRGRRFVHDFMLDFLTTLKDEGTIASSPSYQ